jgi:hypothetical protein
MARRTFPRHEAASKQRNNFIFTFALSTFRFYSLSLSRVSIRSRSLALSRNFRNQIFISISLLLFRMNTQRLRDPISSVRRESECRPCARRMFTFFPCCSLSPAHVKLFRFRKWQSTRMLPLRVSGVLFIINSLAAHVPNSVSHQSPSCSPRISRA